MLPQFVDDYGEGKKLEARLSISHSLFQEGMPGSKVTSVSVDSKGNVKAQVNAVVKLSVEQEPGVWTSARDIYLTFDFKMKHRLDETKKVHEKNKFVLRTMEISQLKVLKGDEEMVAE